mmetsp:Transcript_38330/g.92440  ORF Transcript_38330/g.92440 Transcript_38330/m.92440 type:complete len:391 (+) Transcript_38330:213-1385(+)|eukprot:CAMPEP_0181115776 /NCGR_PEP_ID=MMETSP1071-20121207/21607_1 /TAXON_ID=35127 /ORGANISM="Thalassiosira sp., Strain NH16" /LENGTH=390 /DNA_ID=CAMNT_0023199995 /DNA_START=213 /DNA_END=1385 /DNA_ORIENTATION=-
MTVGDGYRDFIAGTVGGFSAKVFDYPLDTVKVLLQTQNHQSSSSSSSSSSASSSIEMAKVEGSRTPCTKAKVSVHPYLRIVEPTVISSSPILNTIRSTNNVGAITTQTAATSAATKSPPVAYRGAIHCLTHTIQTRGFLSLYSGLASPLWGSMAENAFIFGVYGEMKRLLGERPGDVDGQLTLFQLSMSGAVAGAVGAFVLNPFEVVKVQMQVQNLEALAANGNNRQQHAAAVPRRYSGVWDCVKQTIRNEGILKGLYRGQTSLLLREIPGNFCWYGTYEWVCKLSIPPGKTKRDLSMGTHMLGGAAAGVAYWTAFYPADTVGSRMRADPLYASRGFGDVFLELYGKEGWAGLYRGWSITALRAAPAHALIFAMYEMTLDAFRHYDDKRR